MPNPIQTGPVFRLSNWDYVALAVFIAFVWAVVGGFS